MNVAARAVIIYNLLLDNEYYPLDVYSIQVNMQERGIVMTNASIYQTLYSLEDSKLVQTSRSDTTGRVYWALSGRNLNRVGVAA